MFNPKLILQQVWEGRAPKTWRVFTGKKHARNVGGPLAFAIFLIGIFVLPQSASSVAVADVGLSASYLFMLLLLMIACGAIGLVTQRVMVKLNRNPAPTLVVLPEGVIEYVNQQTPLKGLFFVHVAHMQSRYSREDDGRLMQYLEIQAHDEFVGGWVPPTAFMPLSPIVTCVDELYRSYAKKQYRDNLLAESQQMPENAADPGNADDVWDANVFGTVASFCNIVLADDVEGSTADDDSSHMVK